MSSEHRELDNPQPAPPTSMPLLPTSGVPQLSVTVAPSVDAQLAAALIAEYWREFPNSILGTSVPNPAAKLLARIERAFMLALINQALGLG